MVEGEGEGWQKSSGRNADVSCLLYNTFLLQSFTYSIAYSLVSLKIILFPLLPVSLSFILSPPQNAIVGFFGSSRGGLFGILFKGSLVVQEAQGW